MLLLTFPGLLPSISYL